MTAPALEVRGLRAGYGSVEAVHGIDLTVGQGEVVALFGPNGAGKTTTIRTLIGQLPRLGGQILWDGIDDRKRAHHRARSGVACVTERSVFQQLTVEANLRLGRGRPEHVLDLFPELRPLLRRRAGLLSGGEQQMLTVGRALAAAPRILLLDEVSAGLAPVVVTRLFAAARQAAAEGIAILLVEQQMRRALDIADRCYILSQGRIASSATAAELRANEAELASSYFGRRPQR
jgi:branched-chain amino acid transport system ATP-binding protein